MRTALVVAALAAAVAAALYAATLAQAGSECRACVRFGGGEHCAAARAGSREEAGRAAVATACAAISSGVTASIQCEASEPLSMECR